VFDKGALVARGDRGVRRVWEVVEDRQTVLLARPRRVVAVYPEGQERLLVCAPRGKARELSRPRVYREVFLDREGG